jgi:hypothetical protein
MVEKEILNSITIKNISSMSKDEKTLHIKKLKEYVENLQVINNDIQKEIYYIYSLLKDN